MISQRLLYTTLVAAQELLFGKRLLFGWQLGDNWALASMESLEREQQEEHREMDAADVDRRQDDDKDGKPVKYKLRIVWFNAIGFFILHLAALYGLYLFLTSSMVFTMVWSKHMLRRQCYKFRFGTVTILHVF